MKRGKMLIYEDKINARLGEYLWKETTESDNILLYSEFSRNSNYLDFMESPSSFEETGFCKNMREEIHFIIAQLSHVSFHLIVPILWTILIKSISSAFYIKLYYFFF